MIISCVKWGNKFSHEHVNRLYTMVAKNISIPFTFVCHTENPENIHKDIQIKPLDTSLGLEKWWWKLTLFNQEPGEHIFFDLDVVIQNNLQPIIDSIRPNKLCMIKALWKTYELKGNDMDHNSSVMAWGGDLSHIWDKFEDDVEHYTWAYNGIDGFLYHEIKDINTFPEKLIYSRLFGIDKDNCYSYGDFKGYYGMPDYTVCIFNGWRRDKKDGKYLLDDYGYKGMEHYWNGKNNFTGIDTRVWEALWECEYSGGDTKHFLDSMSPNQVASKEWLIENVKEHHQLSIKKVQLWGGWFAHPIASMLVNDLSSVNRITNLDIDENALHYCRLLNSHLKYLHVLDTHCADVLNKHKTDIDTDLVINTSSEHMPPLYTILAKKEYKNTCLFAVQSNNMFHVPDHINCVNSEDELVENTGLKEILYKGSLDMPNGYKRFMVIGYA